MSDVFTAATAGTFRALAAHFRSRRSWLPAASARVVPVASPQAAPKRLALGPRAASPALQQGLKGGWPSGDEPARALTSVARVPNAASLCTIRRAVRG